jgi:hypothetical protein
VAAVRTKSPKGQFDGYEAATSGSLSEQGFVAAVLLGRSGLGLGKHGLGRGLGKDLGGLDKSPGAASLILAVSSGGSDMGLGKHSLGRGLGVDLVKHILGRGLGKGLRSLGKGPGAASS